MERLVLRRNRRKLVVPMLFFGATLAVGAWMVSPAGGAPVLGWLIIVGSAGLLLVGAWGIALPREQIVIDEAGILDRRMGVGVIPWAEIVDATMRIEHEQASVCLHLRDEEAWIAKLPPMRRATVDVNRTLGYTAFVLPIGAMDASPDEILALIRRQIRGRAVV